MGNKNSKKNAVPSNSEIYKDAMGANANTTSTTTTTESNPNAFPTLTLEETIAFLPKLSSEKKILNELHYNKRHSYHETQEREVKVVEFDDSLIAGGNDLYNPNNKYL